MFELITKAEEYLWGQAFSLPPAFSRRSAKLQYREERLAAG
jgi:hypothetical protein